MIDTDEFLEHYGIKGMKWGHRRGSVPSHKLSTESKKVDKIVEKVNKTGLKSLTNHELSQLNKRMQLEKSFNDTMTKKKDSVKSGKKFAKEFVGLDLTVAGVYTFYKSPVGQALKKMLNGYGEGAHKIHKGVIKL